jgi:hypothetical protein
MQQNEQSRHSKGISFQFWPEVIKVPINQWDELLSQTILTLNLLRQSNVAPNISAWAYHHGSFDYNRMPIAPMGCAVQFPYKTCQTKDFR